MGAKEERLLVKLLLNDAASLQTICSKGET